MYYEDKLEDLKKIEQEVKEAREKMQENAKALREGLSQWSGEALDGLEDER